MFVERCTKLTFDRRYNVMWNSFSFHLKQYNQARNICFLLATCFRLLRIDKLLLCSLQCPLQSQNNRQFPIWLDSSLFEHKNERITKFRSFFFSYDDWCMVLMQWKVSVILYAFVVIQILISMIMSHMWGIHNVLIIMCMFLSRSFSLCVCMEECDVLSLQNEYQLRTTHFDVILLLFLCHFAFSSPDFPCHSV